MKDEEELQETNITRSTGDITTKPAHKITLRNIRQRN
jgi:hypothetical protein